MRSSTREILKSRAKEAFHAVVPGPLSGPVLRAALPGGDPMAPEIVARRAIFIHVPKAAGSSIQTELYGAPLFGHRRIVEFMAYHPAPAAAFFKFCFVRNPWDRLLSAFSYLRQGEGSTWRDRRFAEVYLDPLPDFAAFVAALERPLYRRAVMSYDHFRPQSFWAARPFARGHAMDFVGRFESMERDMAVVRDRLDLPARPLSQARPSRHLPYREAYDARSRATVARIYARDLAMFPYAF